MKGGDGRNLVRKKITYSYLDNYRPTTRVYEVAGNVLYNDAKGAPTTGVGASVSTSTAHTANNNNNTNPINLNSIPHATDLFNTKNNHLNYLVKPFDAHIAESIGKPSHEQINKYLTVINTGVKNPDLIQIHPLLNGKTQIKTQLGASAPDATTSKNQQTPIVPLTLLELVSNHSSSFFFSSIFKSFSVSQRTDSNRLRRLSKIRRRYFNYLYLK